MAAKAVRKKKIAQPAAGTPKPRIAKPRAPKNPYPILDFPQEGERIPRGHYAVRVAAEPEREVEVTFDGKTWNECRPAVGFYWFDWDPKEPGSYTILARSRNGKRSKRSSPRRVEVVPG